MSNTVIIRPLKDGSGFSPCVAAEENVGKKRCNHSHGGSTMVAINKVAPGTSEIVVDTSSISELNDDEKTGLIKGFVTSLKPISKSKLKEVLSIIDKIED